VWPGRPHVEEIVVKDSVDCNLFPHAAKESAKRALALCEDVQQAPLESAPLLSGLIDGQVLVLGEFAERSAASFSSPVSASSRR
jgi:hypothetical protein